jgi:hypothetical protein
MHIMRGFWSILLVLAGCGHVPLVRLVERSSAEDELYAMATRAVLDEPWIQGRYGTREGGVLYCLGLDGHSPHPAFLARFAAHPARVGPLAACTRQPRGLLPDGREALFLSVRFEDIDWSDPEQPLVRATLPVGGGGFEGFALEMRFARDGERWRVNYRSLEFHSCEEHEQLW